MDNNEFLNKSIIKNIQSDGKEISKFIEESNKRKFEIEDLSMESYESIIEINRLTKKELKLNKILSYISIFIALVSLTIGVLVLIVTYLMYINLK